MPRTIFALLILFIAQIIPLGCCASNDQLSALLSRLDQSNSKRDHYESQKLQRIAMLKKQLAKSWGLDKAYDISQKLFDEYASYQYDSAHVYADRLIVMAKKSGNGNKIVESQCDEVFCLLSAGLYNEASDAFDAIDISGATNEGKIKYYQTASRLYYDMGDYCHAEPYQRQYFLKGDAYTDSLLQYINPHSIQWLYAVGMRYMKDRKYEACQKTFNKLLRMPDLDGHTKAIVTSSLGWVVSQSSDDPQNAIEYLVLAAILDNENATKETTALRVLASWLYKRGDIKRATNYVRLSLADANFYGARQRMIEVSEILPIIEQDRYKIVSKQRNAMAAAMTIAVLFVIALAIGLHFIRKQMLKLRQARKIVSERNKQLEKINSQLSEANKIKDVYIGKSFYINAEYINKVEKLYRTLDRKIAARQFADLRSSLKESELVSDRKMMYADFDETFLKLFPTFVEQYNALFDPVNRRVPESPKTLTTEMRIFALIRIGINDSERIAKFLHYSVNTINTYKTRVKNKSLVSNETFEKRIMEIHG